jgi:hypothetical protein
MEIVGIVTTILGALSVFIQSLTILLASLKKKSSGEKSLPWGRLAVILSIYTIIGFISAPSNLALATTLPLIWGATLLWTWFVVLDKALALALAWAFTWTLSWALAWTWVICSDVDLIFAWFGFGALNSAITVISEPALTTLSKKFGKYDGLIIFAGTSLLGLALGWLIFRHVFHAPDLSVKASYFLP